MQKLVSIILIINTSLVIAQKGIPNIKIDLDTKEIIPAILPFDTPILLEITSTKNELDYSLYIYEVNTHKGLKFLGSPLNGNEERKYLDYFQQMINNSLQQSEKDNFSVLQEKFALHAFHSPPLKISSKGVKNYKHYLSLVINDVPSAEFENYSYLLKKLTSHTNENKGMPFSINDIRDYIKYMGFGIQRLTNSNSNLSTEIVASLKKLKNHLQSNPVIKLYKSGKNKYKATIPYLLPNKSYELMFKKKISSKELSKFLVLYDMRKSRKTDDEIKVEYDKIISELEKKSDSPYQKFYLDAKTPTGIGFIGMNWDGFNASNGPFCDFMAHTETEVANLKLNFDPNKVPNLSEIQKVGSLVSKFKLDVSLHSLLTKLTSEDQIQDIGIGKIPIDKSNQKEAGNREYVEKSKNIQRTWHLIEKLDQQLINIISLENGTTLAEHFRNDHFIPIRDFIMKNMNAYSDLIKNISSWLNKEFSFAELISASSIHNEMKTNNGQIIVPDFGLINIIAFENDGTTKYIPRPYAGVNFHFGGGIDKNKRLRNIPRGARKRFWLKSSIGLGVTIGKIDESGFTDFYNGFSPALGYNFRVDDQIRLGTGVLLLREKVKNPIIDKSKVEPSIYINLTFDFGLFSTLGKAASKLIGL